MRLPVHSSLLALALTASAVAMPGIASATDIQMWVRASGATAAQHMIDLWNSSHDDKVVVTVIPDNQMVTKLATGSQAGDVPDTEADVSALAAAVDYRPKVSVEQGVAAFVAWYLAYQAGRA